MHYGLHPPRGARVPPRSEREPEAASERAQPRRSAARGGGSRAGGGDGRARPRSERTGATRPSERGEPQKGRPGFPDGREPSFYCPGGVRAGARRARGERAGRTRTRGGARDFPRAPQRGGAIMHANKRQPYGCELFRVARIWVCALCSLCAAPYGVCPCWLLRADKSRPNGL